MGIRYAQELEDIRKDFSEKMREKAKPESRVKEYDIGYLYRAVIISEFLLEELASARETIRDLTPRENIRSRNRKDSPVTQKYLHESEVVISDEDQRMIQVEYHNSLYKLIQAEIKLERLREIAKLDNKPEELSWFEQQVKDATGDKQSWPQYMIEAVEKYDLTGSRKGDL